jgi:hypothetical protein
MIRQTQWFVEKIMADVEKGDETSQAYHLIFSYTEDERTR